MGIVYIHYTLHSSNTSYTELSHGGICNGNQSWSLTQGKNDEIYIANNEGILKYDAERWTLYPTNSIVRSVAVFDEVLYSGSYMDLGTGKSKLRENWFINHWLNNMKFNLLKTNSFGIFIRLKTLGAINKSPFFMEQSTNQFKQIQPDKAIIKSFVVNQQLFSSRK